MNFQGIGKNISLSNIDLPPVLQSCQSHFDDDEDGQDHDDDDQRNHFYDSVHHDRL